MDRKLLKQIRKVILLESFFSGASSLSRIIDAVEKEIEDITKYNDKKQNSARNKSACTK